MKILADRDMRFSDSMDLVEMTFDFSEPFAELVSLIKRLIKIFAKNKSELARVLLEKRSFNKQELLVIGSIFRENHAWEEIIVERIGYTNFTKQETLSLMKKRSITKRCHLELMRSKRFFSQKRIISLLRKITKRNDGTYIRNKVIELLTVGYGYNAKKFLQIVRKINSGTLWEAFQERFASEINLLTKKDIKNILLKGDWNWRRFAIRRLDIRTLRRIVNTKNPKKRNEGLIGDIIKSKRLSKKLSIKLAREINWGFVWGDLILSGHFSVDEAIAFLKKEAAKYDFSTAWRYLCSNIDLSKRSNDELLEFGNLAESDETWEMIIKVLNKRKENVK